MTSTRPSGANRGVRRGGVLLAAFLSVYVLVAGIVTPPTPAWAYSQNASITSTDFDARIIYDINQARQNNGRAPLQVMSGWTDMAAGWAYHMANANGLSHNPNAHGQASAECPYWTSVGENVARIIPGWSESSAQAADRLFNAYRNSSAHWANILDSVYTQVGVVSVDRMESDFGRPGIFNDITFGTGCSPGSQHSRTWGLWTEELQPGSGQSVTVDSFSHPDNKIIPARWSQSMTSQFSYRDNTGQLTVRNASSHSSGMAGIVLTQGVDLSAATTLSVRLEVATLTNAEVPLTVAVREMWGDSSANNGRTCVIGSVLAPPSAGTLTLTIPSQCQFTVNTIILAVGASQLASVSPNPSEQVATFTLSGLSVR